VEGLRRRGVGPGSHLDSRLRHLAVAPASAAASRRIMSLSRRAGRAAQPISVMTFVSLTNVEKDCWTRFFKVVLRFRRRRPLGSTR
jgi:hypothetical protein